MIQLWHSFGIQVDQLSVRLILTIGAVAEGPGTGTKLQGRCWVDTVDGGPPSHVNIIVNEPWTDAMARASWSSLISWWASLASASNMTDMTHATSLTEFIVTASACEAQGKKGRETIAASTRATDTRV